MRSLYFIVSLITLLSMHIIGRAGNLKELVELDGSWKFSVGDNPKWADSEYDDSEWDFVRVPGSWEDNGFKNYNGYAWYRKSFNLYKQLDDEYVFLMVGYIDDIDEVYINGHLVGSTGIFPPLVRTAHNLPRKYPVPTDILNQQGKNVIAVRVYDEYHEGGIVRGPVGLYYEEDNRFLMQDLSGYWDFETKNNYPEYVKPIHGKVSGKIFVPGNWETQGYLQYDGYAAYHTSFKLNEQLLTEDELVLVLGYIDDKDKIYLNGKKIGSAEQISKYKDESNYYRILRGYKIPDNILAANSINTLTVKVYDTRGLGGIYAGPVGITTESNFRMLKKNQKDSQDNFWYDFIRSFWD